MLPDGIITAFGLSRPARGAWIEIPDSSGYPLGMPGRAPQGARGLKSYRALTPSALIRSRPARGAWIEIAIVAGCDVTLSVAPRKGRVD